MKERFNGGKAGFGWEEKRKEFFERRWMEIKEIEGKEMEEEDCFREIERRESEEQERERWERIRVLRYNKWYGMIKDQGISNYLKTG